MNRLHFYALLVLLAFSTGCKKDSTESEPAGVVRFTLEYDGQPVSLEEVFETSDGYRMRLDRLDFYVSETSFYLDAVPDTYSDIQLISFDAGNTSYSYKLTRSIAEGVGLQIGIPPEINDDPDPSQYATDHPLSDFSGMYWSWNSGYKFVQLEGKVDLTGTDGAALDHPLSMHTGLNENLKNIYLEKNLTVDCEQIVANIAIDIKDWFTAVHAIDVAIDSETHTTDNPELAAKFSDNFAESMRIQ